jgi:hypothetical protein
LKEQPITNLKKIVEKKCQAHRPAFSAKKTKNGTQKNREVLPSPNPTQKKGTPVPAKNSYHQQPLRME